MECLILGRIYMVRIIKQSALQLQKGECGEFIRTACFDFLRKWTLMIIDLSFIYFVIKLLVHYIVLSLLFEAVTRFAL